MKKSKFWQLINSPLALGALLVLLIGLATVQYRQFKQRRSISEEIRNLQQQQAGLEQKNQQLSDSLQYLSTSDYKDRVARQELGLKRNGELVYNFTAQSSGNSAAQETANMAPAGSNAERWLLYLFKNSN